MIGRGKARAPAAGDGRSGANSTVHGSNIQIGGSFTGDLLILLDRRTTGWSSSPPLPPSITTWPGGRRASQLSARPAAPGRAVSAPTDRAAPHSGLARRRHRGGVGAVGDRAGWAGKTRFASHVASACFGAGWAVAQAVERSPELRTGQSSVQVLAENQPLLVVMDYAERWRLPVLAHLVEGLPLEYPRRRVRVLLLARPGPGLWEDIAATLARGRVDLRDPLPLGELDADRVAVLIDAATAYRRLAETEPTAYLPALAMSLWGYAWVRTAGQLQLDDALAAVEEAAAIYRSLADTLPHAFTGYLRATISTHADVLDGLGRSDEAEEL